MIRFGNAIILGMSLSAASLIACSSGTPGGTPIGAPGSAPGISSNGTDQVGTVSFKLQIGSVTLNTLTYTITNPTLAGFTTITAPLDVSSSQGIGFTLALPAGSGYTLSLNGSDTSGDPCSGGPVSFSVMAGQSTTIGLTLTCSQTIDAGLIVPDVQPGTIVVDADAAVSQTIVGTPCAAATTLVAAPNRINVGRSIPLSGAGVDPSFSNADVTLTWTATGSAGSLASTAGTTNSFACTAPGTATVTVTASISNGGASCPGIGSLTATLECDATGQDAGTGAPDAGADTSTEDAGTAEDASAADAGSGSSTDATTGVPDGGSDAGADAMADVTTGGPDAGPDTSTATPDAGSDSGVTGTDAGPETGGPLVPCTTAGQTNCVSCPNKTAGVCTPTEAAFVQLDINASVATTPGPDSDASGCYQCLLAGSCLDTPHIHTFECGDLPGNFANGSGASVVAADACLATLECEIGAAGQQCGKSANGLSFCYCGNGGGAPTACASHGSSANGACLTQTVAGLKYPATDANDILINLTDSTQPSGLANNILGCAQTNNCNQCLQ